MHPMTRRQARKRVLDLLFEMDLGNVAHDEVLSRLPVPQPDAKDEEAFVSVTMAGILDHLPEIDSFVDSFSPHWPLGRMGSADRNILRIACYELLYRQDIPAPVSINEAVVLAKKFGGEGSGKFVNGILGAISRSGSVSKVTHSSPAAAGSDTDVSSKDGGGSPCGRSAAADPATPPPLLSPSRR